MGKAIINFSVNAVNVVDVLNFKDEGKSICEIDGKKVKTILATFTNKSAAYPGTCKIEGYNDSINAYELVDEFGNMSTDKNYLYSRDRTGLGGGDMAASFRAIKLSKAYSKIRVTSLSGSVYPQVATVFLIG